MSCNTLREAIVELGRGANIGVGTAAAVESHVEHCAPCRARLVRERQLNAGLRALAAADAANGASDTVKRQLIEAFAEHQWSQAHVPAASMPVYRWLPAAAAIVMLVGAAWWWTTPRVSNGVPRIDRQAAVKQPETRPDSSPSAAAGKAVPPTIEQSALVDGTRVRPASTRRGSRPASRIVSAEGFVALPTALGLPEFESGRIVRVEIPLTSLPAYGLEILPDARIAPVEADVLVGQDGQARAIRLVARPSSESRSW